jgi:HSP20 family protein
VDLLDLEGHHPSEVQQHQSHTIKEQIPMADTTTLPQKGRTEPAVPEVTYGGSYFTPRVDILETDKELTLFADVPGVRPEDVNLRYDKGELILHGRVQPRPSPGAQLLNEYEVGDFYRAFSIHESIDSTKIAAECKNGVLTVHLPKVEAAQPRQISVRAN